MKVLEKIKSFFKPSTSKIIISTIVIIYAFYVTLNYPWGHDFSPIPLIIFKPLIFLGIFSLIFIIPYSYIIACLISLLFQSIKKKKWILILVIVISILLLGIDEPVINNIINKPDYSCSIDSDCVVKFISKGWCGNPRCINQNWKYYDSIINSASALSCIETLLSCSCIKNKCEAKDLSQSTNLKDCENLTFSQKEYCRDVILHNIINSANEIISQKFCEIEKEYGNNAVNPVTCTCPAGYEFETVFIGWGPCPREGMSDCSASVLKCIKKPNNPRILKI